MSDSSTVFPSFLPASSSTSQTPTFTIGMCLSLHDTFRQYILFVKTKSCTYDHRILRALLPVRSAYIKQDTGRLVVRWVTTGESLLLYVFAFSFACQCHSLPPYLERTWKGERIVRVVAGKGMQLSSASPMCSFCYIVAIYFTRSIYVTSNAVICYGDSDEHSVLRPTRIRVAELRIASRKARR
jgi:hypothetical protein